MSKYLYNRFNQLVGSLFISAVLCQIAFSSTIERKPKNTPFQSERLVNLTIPDDPIRSSIFTDTGISIKVFRSVVVDNDNTKWFVSEQGIVSFDGEKWVLHNKNPKVATQDLNDVAYVTGGSRVTNYGPLGSRSHDNSGDCDAINNDVRSRLLRIVGARSSGIKSTTISIVPTSSYFPDCCAR